MWRYNLLCFHVLQMQWIHNTFLSVSKSSIWWHCLPAKLEILLEDMNLETVRPKKLRICQNIQLFNRRSKYIRDPISFLETSSKRGELGVGVLSNFEEQISVIFTIFTKPLKAVIFQNYKFERQSECIIFSKFELRGSVESDFLFC